MIFWVDCFAKGGPARLPSRLRLSPKGAPLRGACDVL